MLDLGRATSALAVLASGSGLCFAGGLASDLAAAPSEGDGGGILSHDDLQLGCGREARRGVLLGAPRIAVLAVAATADAQLVGDVRGNGVCLLSLVGAAAARAAGGAHPRTVQRLHFDELLFVFGRHRRLLCRLPPTLYGRNLALGYSDVKRSPQEIDRHGASQSEARAA